MEFEDNYEVPELDLDFVVQPYMFEPLVNGRSVTRRDESSDTDHEDDEVEDQETSDSEQLPQNTDWCSCKNCEIMQSVKECKCCRDTNIVDGKIEEAGISCITEHESFQVNCLNHHVLELSYYEYIEYNGPLEPDQMIHKVYRYIAYRRFARFIWKRLGKRNRRILPACVVSAIRRRYPSQEYCGFKYPDNRK